MILMLNNRDSFVFNLARYFSELGCEMNVVDSDQIAVTEIEALAPEALVISPGPCTPAEAGISIQAINALGARLPILGVCLGHQAIAAAHGWPVTHARSPAHGRAARITHTGQRLFAGLPGAFEVGLYHSLIAAAPDAPGPLVIDAVSPSGEVMALSHPEKPIYGIQFHPESILTQHGPALLQNFLNIARAWRQT
ncbi:4-amino-4-deoxychorismate synthase, glutamine amidotransferase subunit [Hyphomonas neptunium ATCC 15444]|uniref:4-amino-4-deoxychorismate synthase, glutamine amidotransferase subunit n=2 Tax=Hyphomonas TaxID=85 RepID=Q0BZN0_HYPNA|nr:MULTISPECIES: aminodeoxychorismate/anthranilate synthase component II [Hyphomonas]ABI76582.1 4-amino-4-deoxychorismate synthase, glutamine amidotransferase subunit [Hyphomonas neptunium ATCC 15444]KCZ86762.1 4-amino-4-deoxychorismate synthase, glutamine amidotransferase subunit [Hyphomonas hirschiana VP5]